MGTTHPSRELGSRWVLAAKGRCVDGHRKGGEIGMRQKQLNFNDACWPLPALGANQYRAGPADCRALDQGLIRTDRAFPKHPAPEEDYQSQLLACRFLWQQLCSSQLPPALPVRFVSSCGLDVRVKLVGQAPPGCFPTCVPAHWAAFFAGWAVGMSVIGKRALVVLQHLSCFQAT